MSVRHCPPFEMVTHEVIDQTHIKSKGYTEFYFDEQEPVPFILSEEMSFGIIEIKEVKEGSVVATLK